MVVDKVWRFERIKKSHSCCRVVDKGIDLDLLTRIYRNPPRFDTRKANCVLGLEYIDIGVTAKSMAEALVKFGYA